MAKGHAASWWQWGTGPGLLESQFSALSAEPHCLFQVMELVFKNMNAHV